MFFIINTFIIKQTIQSNHDSKRKLQNIQRRLSGNNGAAL